ncbi:MAG: hypothetical protein ACE5I1_15675 [bacterium]
MAYQLSNKNFNYWIAWFKDMVEAQEKSGVALREELKAALDAAKGDFEQLVNQYKSLRSNEKQVRRDATNLQKQGLQVLDRIRHALISQIAKKQIDAVLQAYDLDRRTPNRREDVLHSLRLANEAVGRESDDNRKPPVNLQTELTNVYGGMTGKLEELQAILSGREEIRRKLREAMVTNAELRERIQAYLISILPGRRRDPKLMDYGLRESFKTRGRSVTVVAEEDAELVTEPVDAED